MKNICLFIISFLLVAGAMLLNEYENMPDYQAYTKPRMEVQ